MAQTESLEYAGELQPASAPAVASAALLAPATRTCPNAPIEQATGTVHYVCDCGPGAAPGCVPGQDSANGLSPATAWQTYERARTAFASSQPGDITAFCRGGSFTVGSGNRWVANACRASNPCVIRDYATPWGGSAKPLIRVTNAGGRGFGFEDGGNSDHDEGYTVLGLALQGPGSGAGFFLYNDVDDVMLCDLSVDGFALGVNVAGSNPPANAASDAKNSRITLRSSRITNNTQQGWLGGCDGCSLEYNYFENNGFERETFLHNIYIGTGNDQRVIGNQLYRNAIVNGACSAVSLVGHGEFHGLLIEDNLIRELPGQARSSCWGIAIDSGYAGTPEAFTDVTIRGNTVINVGNMSIGVNACQNCVIENNVVVQEQAFGGIGIAVPDRAREANDLELSNVTVRNNSIYFGPASGGTGIVLGGQGTGHVLVSNAIHYAGTSSTWSCFTLDLPLASYSANDNNLCHAPAASDQWVRGRGNLAAWQAYSGTSTASSTANPLYASVSGGNYQLSPASALSPLVNAGHPTLSAPLAIGGAARGASPDIGAYEWNQGGGGGGNTPPVATITQPAAGTEFFVGQTITLRGTGSDSQDGALPGSALSWRVLQHHDTHTHVYLPPTAGSSVVITAPPPENLAATETSYLEVQLTATDSGGLRTTTTRVIEPRIVSVEFRSVPSGRTVTINGTTFTTPVTLSSWERYALNVDAPVQPGYVFASWSDGGAKAHTITTPASPAVYTATFSTAPAATSVRVNFQPSYAPVPAGYLRDSGAVFGARGNGQSYGWNASNAWNARDRNAANSPDQRYDTFMYMQRFPNSNARWELQVPNGSYRVRIVAGDPSNFNSVFRISAEGVLVVSGTPTSAARWIDATATVTVRDGRLTIANAASASNNKINFIEVTAP